MPATPTSSRQWAAAALVVGVGIGVVWLVAPYVGGLLLAPVLVIATAVGVLGWYARHSYFIGQRDGVVVIYQGVPGGVVGWNPTIREPSTPPLRVVELTEQRSEVGHPGAIRRR